MTTITKITIPCTDDTMGDSSPEDCNAYRAWFAQQLETEYPDASITVTNRSGRIEIEADDGSDVSDLIADLNEFQNRCWDRCSWDFIKVA